MRGSDALHTPKSSLPIAPFSTQWFSCFSLVLHINLLQKAGFELCCSFLCRKEKKRPQTHTISFLFSCSKTASPRLRRLLLPAPWSTGPPRKQLPVPGMGCDPRSHRGAPLPCSAAEVKGFCTFQTQFLSFVSVRSLPDEGQINRQLSPPTPSMFINRDLNSYNFITFCK